MDDALWKQLPVYRQIELSLKEYINANELGRHARLPSEAQLAQEHGASVGTVRKALNNLVAEKIIYRRHGQGTFVAPRIRKGKVIVVPNRQGINRTRDDYFDFFLGALSESNGSDLPLEPMVVELDDFFANLDDVEMVYPELEGVIFFRGYANLAAAEEVLRRKNLPFMFYGPNLYGSFRGRCSSVFHNESMTTELIAEYLAAKGVRKAAGLFDAAREVESSRSERLAAALGKRRIGYRVMNAQLLKDPVAFRGAAREVEVICGLIDPLAIEAIQLAARVGIRVPEELAVVGIDNLPAGEMLHPTLTSVDLCNYENGRLCIRELARFIKGGAKRPFHLDGKLELVRRESC